MSLDNNTGFMNMCDNGFDHKYLNKESQCVYVLGNTMSIICKLIDFGGLYDDDLWPWPIDMNIYQYLNRPDITLCQLVDLAKTLASFVLSTDWRHSYNLQKLGQDAWHKFYNWSAEPYWTCGPKMRNSFQQQCMKSHMLVQGPKCPPNPYFIHVSVPSPFYGRWEHSSSAHAHKRGHSLAVFHITVCRIPELHCAMEHSSWWDH